MTELSLKSKNYRKIRLKNLFVQTIKKTGQILTLVIVGEYLLLNVVNMSLSQKNPILNYRSVPEHILNLAVSERPILRVARAYTSIKKNIDFDQTVLRHHPVQIKGSRPDFRAFNLQDKEGAQFGYVFKF